MDTTLPPPSPLSPTLAAHPAPRATAAAAPLPASQLLVLAASGHSQAVDCPDPCELRVLQGRIWLSREGSPEDLFLDSGQSLRLQAPARLHLSAELGAPAWVRLVEG